MTNTNNKELRSKAIALILEQSKDFINTNDYKLLEPYRAKTLGLDVVLSRDILENIETQLTQMTDEDVLALANDFSDIKRRLDAVGFLRPSLTTWKNAIRDYINTDMEEIYAIQNRKAAGVSLTEAERMKLSAISAEPEVVDVLKQVIKQLENLEKIENLIRERKQKTLDDKERLVIDTRIGLLEADLPKDKAVAKMVKFVQNVVAHQVRVSRFDNETVFAYQYMNNKQRLCDVNSTNIREFVQFFTGTVDQRLAKRVLNSAATIVSIYPVGDRGGYLVPLDPTKRSHHVEEFAKFIDAQVGFGGFAAYMLYPILYTSMDLGIKRHIVVGTEPSTGKSILGNFLNLLYKGLPFVIGPRTEQSQSGYNATKHNWNKQIIDKPIVYIDDDAGDHMNREDFYKNLWMKNGITTGSGGREENNTFFGFCYSNTNTFDKSIGELEQVSKRVYVFNLVTKFNEVFKEKGASSVFYEMDTPNSQIDRDHLVNYLLDHVNDAASWLMNYVQPEAVASVNKRSEEYNMVAFILAKFKENLHYNKELNPNTLVKNPWIPVEEIKKQFSFAITHKTIMQLHGGAFKVAGKLGEYAAVGANTGKTYWKHGKSATSVQMQCITFADGVTFDDFADIDTEDIEAQTNIDEGATETTPYDLEQVLSILAFKQTEPEYLEKIMDKILDLKKGDAEFIGKISEKIQKDGQ